jgi:hypothetical protein
MKTFKTILVASVLFFGILLLSFYDNHYNRQAIVTKVDGKIITFTDTSDNTWVFENNKAVIFKVGAKAKLLMFNNNTEEYIYDDEIIKVTELK